MIRQTFQPPAAMALAIAMVVVAANVHAQDASSKTMAKPAASSSPPAAGGMLNPANWKLPSWRSILPQQEEQQRVVAKKDSLFTEVKTTMSNSWQRTKSVFNPAKLNPMRSIPASSRTPSATPAAKPNFFQSLFSAPEPEPQKFESVGDFLKQDRIQPGM